MAEIPGFAERDRVCPACGGAGVVRDTAFVVPSTGIAAAGRSHHVREVIPCDACAEKPSAELLLRQSGLPAPMRSWTFATFAGDQLACATVSIWVGLVASGDSRSMLLAGGNGRGKTGLAAAAVNALCEAGIAVRFVVVRDMLQEIRRRFADDSADAYRDQLRAAPVLILDDVTALKVTEWAEESILGLIDGRLADGRPTLVTTHSSPKDIEEKLGAPTADRLKQYEAVVVRGESMRGHGQ